MVGDIAALPSTRIVTTAGATTLTTSAYESRPAATGWAIVGAEAAAAGGADASGIEANPPQAAPASKTPVASRASPLFAHGPMRNTSLFIGVCSSIPIRRDAPCRGRCWSITSVRGKEGQLLAGPRDRQRHREGAALA